MSEGLLNDEEKFLFDLKGYIVFPGVLSEQETKVLRDYAEVLHRDPESLEPAERQVPGVRPPCWSTTQP